MPLTRLLFLCCLLFIPTAAHAQSIHDGDRIVFIGDSITGQGGNLPRGWTQLMREALAQTHPAKPPVLIPLGGSGQTVGSWTNIEKKSRDQSVVLDVRGIDVKATLDQPADVVVVMLGMNDVLSPSLDGSEAGYDNWLKTYSSLISAVRERTHPRLLALATVPLCTEDEASPKNQAIAALSARLKTLTATENALLLPVHQSMLDMLAQGRTLRPDFHLTVDFVHPNDAGHLAIAEGMLNGLGETNAAQHLHTRYASAIWQKTASFPVFSYAVTYVPASLDTDTQNCTIHFTWNPTVPGQPDTSEPPLVALKAPPGWQVFPAAMRAKFGDFNLTGPFDRLKNRLTLQATAGETTKTMDIDLPAPWLIATSGLRQFTWGSGNNQFNAAQARLPIDYALLAGKSWATETSTGPDTPIRRQRLYPSISYLGGAEPGSVDMAAATFFNSFEVAHGARWLYSETEQPIQFKLNSASFGGNDYLALYLNGQPLYTGSIMRDRGKVVDAVLKPGWNPLVFKSNHLQWQWHFSVEILGWDGKVSTVPR